MPKKKLIRTNKLVYHLTSRTNSKEFWSIPMEECWELFLNELSRAHEKFNLEIHSFILMSNHYHLMARTPESNIDKVMHTINRNMACGINVSSGRINHVFGAPYNWSIIDSQKYYFYAIKYLYQNPIKAGLCSRVEDYPFSSLKRKKLTFPVSPYEEYDVENLNIYFNDIENEQVKKGLKKAIFKPSYNPNSRIRTL